MPQSTEAQYVPEKYVRQEIKKKYGTIQQFCAANNFSYSTVINAFRYGLLRCQTKTVLAICSALDLNVTAVLTGNLEEPENKCEKELREVRETYIDFLQMQRRQIDLELMQLEIKYE